MPDNKGRFGDFGGRFVPELLMPALLELEKAYEEAIQDDGFKEELHDYLTQYVGRTTPLYEAKNLAKHLGSGRIFLKREDLNHTGAHKINNSIDRKSTRLNSSHVAISYAVFCLKKKKSKKTVFSPRSNKAQCEARRSTN